MKIRRKIIKVEYIIILLAILGLLSCGALLSSALREDIEKDANHGLGSYTDFNNRFIYVYDVKNPDFTVRFSPVISDLFPAKLPMDAITYALCEFGGLDKSYKYLNRIKKAAWESIRDYGYAEITVNANNSIRMIQLVFHKKTKHLEVLMNTGINPVINAIDLSDGVFHAN